MFHKVKAVNALPDYRLSVQFAEGVTKIYDVKPLFAKWAPFSHHFGKRAIVFGPLIFGFYVGLDNLGIFGSVFTDDVASSVAGGVIMGDDFKRKIGFLNQESFEALGDEFFLIERSATDADERFGILRPFGRNFILSS